MLPQGSIVSFWYNPCMKAVVQRVSSAQVTEVESGTVVGNIQKGLFVLVGIKKGDTEATAIELANKITKLRIFEVASGKMGASAIDLKLPVLLVSQFTLLANTKDGNRPSFLDAEEATRATDLYKLLVSECSKDIAVETGSFGHYMTIHLELDGPVTIVLDL